jgi:hypothetical protein
MSDPVDLNERERLRRWLAAVGLTGAAEDAARVDTPETNAMALLGGHVACEALLGLLAGVERLQAGKDIFFWRLLDQAKLKVNTVGAEMQIGPDLSDHLVAMNGARNGFVHAGNAVAAGEATRAISNARRLMELVPASLGRSWALPVGAGLGTAVAKIIGVEAVGIWLRFADDMQRLQPDRPELAADGLAHALDSALMRTRPMLLRDPWPGPSTRSLLPRIAATPDRVAKALDQRADAMDQRADRMDRRLEGISDWVLPLALGTSPVLYQRLREIIGWAHLETVGLGPGGVSRVTEAALSRDVVRRANSQTAEIIFRLWAMGSLENLPSDDKSVEATRMAIAQLSGTVPEELARPEEPDTLHQPS